MPIGLADFKVAGLTVAIGAVHFAASTVSYVQTNVAASPADHFERWRALSAILGFPLVYLAKELPLGFDAFPIAIVANSLLWGALTTLLIAIIGRKVRGVIGARRSGVH